MTVAITAQLLAAAPAQRLETARPDSGDFVMRGCVHGSLLKSIRLDPGTVAGAMSQQQLPDDWLEGDPSQIKKADGRCGRDRPTGKSMTTGPREEQEERQDDDHRWHWRARSRDEYPSPSDHRGVVWRSPDRVPGAIAERIEPMSVSVVLAIAVLSAQAQPRAAAQDHDGVGRGMRVGYDAEVRAPGHDRRGRPDRQPDLQDDRVEGDQRGS